MFVRILLEDAQVEHKQGFIQNFAFGGLSKFSSWGDGEILSGEGALKKSLFKLYNAPIGIRVFENSC